MKQSFLISLKEKFFRKSKTPWACFETAGPNAAGRLEFSISWNPAFVANLRKLGYTGVDDEDVVNMFFLSTRVLPENLLNSADGDYINPAEMPNLTNEANFLKQ